MNEYNIDKSCIKSSVEIKPEKGSLWLLELNKNLTKEEIEKIKECFVANEAYLILKTTEDVRTEFQRAIENAENSAYRQGYVDGKRGDNSSFYYYGG